MTTASGGSASVVALSYGERGELGELWKEPGQTVERVKQIRHAEAEAAAKALGATFSCLDLGDYPLQLDGARSTRLPTRSSSARPTSSSRIPTATRSTRTTRWPTPRSTARASARRGRGRCQRVHDDPPARAVPVRAAPARAVQLHADDVPRHHRRCSSGSRRRWRQMAAQGYLRLLRRARRAPRQPRAAHLGRPATSGTPRRSCGPCRRWWAQL